MYHFLKENNPSPNLKNLEKWDLSDKNLALSSEKYQKEVSYFSLTNKDEYSTKISFFELQKIALSPVISIVLFIRLCLKNLIKTVNLQFQIIIGFKSFFMQIIDGNKVSQQIRDQIKQETLKLVSQGFRAPHLSAILVGNDGASMAYVGAKERDCMAIGFGSSVHKLPENTTQEELIELIHTINQSNDTDGLIVQLPLPKHISEKDITDAIHPSKDVDGFTPFNFGLVARGEGGYIPATPFGILKLLESYNIETSGKHCVVIGRSNIVGRPMSILMSQAGPVGNATVTLCHSKTKNLEFFTQMADIIIVAIGKPGFLDASMVKEGAVVIDVGISRVEDKSNSKGYVLKGDTNFDSLSTKCSALTPVPGGVGPMTRVGLLLNTLQAYKTKNKLA